VAQGGVHLDDERFIGANIVTLTFIGIAWALSGFHFAGEILFPFFAATLMIAAEVLSKGGRVEYLQIFKFIYQVKRKLLSMGLMISLFKILLLLIIVFFSSAAGDYFTSLGWGFNQAQKAMIGSSNSFSWVVIMYSFLQSSLVGVFVFIVVIMASKFWYVLPLIAFTGLPIGEVGRLSVEATNKNHNVMKFLSLYLILGLFVVVFLLPVAVVVFIPWVSALLFVGYRDVFLAGKDMVGGQG